jgi:hypothetical protein
MIWQLYLAIFIIVSAFHDGMAELLRSSTSGSPELIKSRNIWWHYAGSALYIIAAVPLLIKVEWWRILIVGALIRSCLFNPIRNITCMEPVWYVGHSAHTDVFLRRIAGQNGGWVLSALSFLLLLIYNIFL